MFIMSKPSYTDLILHKLLLPDEAAGILGVTSATLAVWRSTSRYPLPYVKSGGKVMYRPEDLDAFIKTRTFNGQPIKTIESYDNSEINEEV
jgi:DNA-binding transcriptional MerR regulator